MTATDEVTPDPIMNRIAEATVLGGAGDPEAARIRLSALWAEIGVAGDPLHRCTLAHHLADVCADPAQALMWDTRALDAAEALTDHRVQRHHAGLQVAGFYPSLHLNIADNLRRLSSFAAAAEHIAAAKHSVFALADDTYGSMVRLAIDEVAEAIDVRSTAKRASAPG